MSPDTKESPSSWVVRSRVHRLVSEYLDVFSGSEQLTRIQSLLRDIDHAHDDVMPVMALALDHEHAMFRCVASAMILAGASELKHIMEDFPDLPERATRQFIAALQDSDEEVRFWACHFLLTCPVPKAIWPLLKQLMDDPEPKVQMTAAAALCATGQGSQRMMQLLRQGLKDDLFPVQRSAGMALARLVDSQHLPEAVEVLINGLMSGDEGSMVSALIALKELGPAAHDALPTLRAMIDNQELPPSGRMGAAATIGYVTKDMGMVERVLMPLLHSKDSHVVHGAINGLIGAEYFSDDYVDQLAKLLAAHEEEVRALAADALAAMGQRAKAALPALLGRIGKETSHKMIEAVSEAIAAMGQDAIPPLIAAIKGRGLGELLIPVIACRRLGAPAAAALADAMSVEPDEMVAAMLIAVLRDLGKAVTDAVPQVGELLRETPHEEIALHAVMAIFHTGPGSTRAIPALIHALLNRSDEVASWAERALWNAGPDALPTLEEAFRSAKPFQQQRLARVLARIQRLPEAENDEFKWLENLDADLLLVRFVHMAKILAEEQGPMSYQELETELLEKQKRNEVPEMAVGHSTLRVTINTLEKKLKVIRGKGVSLISRRESVEGELTDDGRKLLIAAEEYLRRKAINDANRR